MVPPAPDLRQQRRRYDLRSMQTRLRESWWIGEVEVPTRVVLAPMAGVSVQAFRRQGRRFGAGLVCSEMVSCAGIEHRNERTLDYLRVGRDEHPLAIQIFGSEPRMMAEAARMVEAAGADIVDMNFGCPVRKVTKTGAGAHLLEDPVLACRIVEDVAPRGLGAGDGEDAARRGGRRADVSRARAALRRGGRCVADAPSTIGPADVHRLRRSFAHSQLVELVDVPVVASGDVTSRAKAEAVIDATGAAAGSWSGRRAGQSVGAARDRRRRRNRAVARGGRRGVDRLHPRDGARAGRTARKRVPEEVLQLVSRLRASSRSHSSRSWSVLQGHRGCGHAAAGRRPGSCGARRAARGGAAGSRRGTFCSTSCRSRSTAAASRGGRAPFVTLPYRGLAPVVRAQPRCPRAVTARGTQLGPGPNTWK